MVKRDDKVTAQAQVLMSPAGSPIQDVGGSSTLSPINNPPSPSFMKLAIFLLPYRSFNSLLLLAYSKIVFPSLCSDGESLEPSVVRFFFCATDHRRYYLFQSK